MMTNKISYKKAEAEVVLFDNSDVITTSGVGDGSNFTGGDNSCRTPGHNRGNGCSGTSGSCVGQSWK